MQVASRLLLVWGIVNNFPHTTSRSPVYSSMLIAWSVTEITRYSYFAINLSTGFVPAFLTWLRYNTFFVLYPLGISSECWLVYKAIQPAKQVNAAWEYVLKLILFVYVPGTLVVFCFFSGKRWLIRGLSQARMFCSRI
ncbi:MAG: protein tyrosine phosphatase-like domain-containing protein [Janthinobacterium lividum]